MSTSTLPFPVTPPPSGWAFQGTWTALDQTVVEQALRQRIPNPGRAQADPWLFLAHAGIFYAHSPTVHSNGVAFAAATPAGLADLLWDHYFSLHLGPLAWSLPTGPAQLPAPSAARPDDQEPPADAALLSFDQERQALQHFETACVLLAEGDYAAAKLELDLSLSIAPAQSFFDYRRVETLADIESTLGNDDAALQHYEHALALADGWRANWTQTELRLKLAWALLRQERIDAAQDMVETTLALCQKAATTSDDTPRGLNYLTALALATQADVHFHRNDVDAAIASARRAAGVAGRLGQAYADKVRLLTYLAWQLYHHDEGPEARTLARRAQAALDRWMPIDARHVQSLRTTIATILGAASRRTPPTPHITLPTPALCIVQALAAARGMQNWRPQLLALHALAPHLAPGQVPPPLDDIHVWSEELSHERQYQILLAADLAHTLADPAPLPSDLTHQLTAIEPRVFHYLGYEWLYAETLLRRRAHLDAAGQALVDRAIARCAAGWCEVLQGPSTGGAQVTAIEGLAVLLPELPPDVRRSACLAIESALLAQLEPHISYYPNAFLAGLPALARYGAGQAVVEAIMRRERRGARLVIACLAHLDAADAEDLIEALLRGLENWLAQASSTDVAESLWRLAPYLRAEQARRALALATSVRSIVPRVRALVAVAQMLPADEAMVVYDIAWKAAQRSTSADVRGEALSIVAVGLAAPRRCRESVGGTGDDDTLVA